MIGKWKLIVRYGDEKDSGNELYDLTRDPGELKNVAKEHPEIAKQMAAAFQAAEAAGRTRR